MAQPWEIFPKDKDRLCFKSTKPADSQSLRRAFVRELSFEEILGNKMNEKKNMKHRFLALLPNWTLSTMSVSSRAKSTQSLFIQCPLPLKAECHNVSYTDTTTHLEFHTGDTWMTWAL